ncbi:MAG: acetylxylan esterase [Bacteroidales bacterium]|nr:acetylxylan esterase [Bacteroidales bacterium]
MKHLFRTLILAAALVAAASFTADAKKKKADLVETYPALAPYFSTPVEEAVQPDELGFIRRWLLLEPISKPNRGNTVFVDSYIRKNLDTGWNKGEFTLPKDGDKETMMVEYQKPVDMTAGRPMWGVEPETEMKKVKLTWHALDSKLFNVKLYRYAVGTETGRYGLICRVVTVIDCPEDIENVRLAVGSNSASMWWIDGEEALIMSGDRRMVMDDAASKRITLKKGRHILTGAVINGPGMSDFCVRFIDENGNPVHNYNILNK